MRIVRSPDPGPFNHYRDYKPHLQPLFRCRCAYCLSHEDQIGRFDEMQVDHFRPKGRREFAHLEREWANLYYCCGRCNRHKSDHWPTDQETQRGLRFVDPCLEDPDEHFRLCRPPQHDDLCYVMPLTTPAQYTIAKVRLNRNQLVQIRRSLAVEEREDREQLRELSRAIEELGADTVDRGLSAHTAEIMRLLETQHQRCLARLERIRSLRPFPLAEQP